MILKRDRSVFIQYIGKIALQDWKKRHICLPSLTVAIAVEGIDWRNRRTEIEREELFPLQRSVRKHALSFEGIVVQHTDFLASWKKIGQAGCNWEHLIGEVNYIRAVQFLQEAKYPYSTDKLFEYRIIEIIEDYGLVYLDE